jgi:pSer/pThr/pTyr-binding forkhead associated (FHA) protein
MSLLTEILVKAGLARKHTAPPPRREMRDRAKWNFGSLLKADSDADSMRAYSRLAADNTFKATQTRYAPIRNAVEERLETFVRRDVVSHLEIAREDVFMLHYLEINADQDESLLNEFLEEFKQPARIDWVKRLLAAAPESHVRVDQFLGMDKQFSKEHLEKTDPFEEELTRDAAVSGYRVVLHGRWERQAPFQPAEDTARVVRVPGVGLRLAIHDAREKAAGPAVARHVDVDTFPVVLGSSSDADVQISGYYVSARHCTLHWDGHEVSLEDHSKNGTWLDGKALERGSRVAFNDTAVLSFGGQEASDYERFPVVHAQKLAARVAHAGRTPIAPSRATPIASTHTPISAPKAALAVLAITDATGTAHKVICELPFTIGRGSDQDYVVPDENAGVSREHLVIEKITEAGAIATNKGVDRNGTFAADQALPQQFEWRFDQEIVLARKWTRASPPRVVLKRAGE